MSFEERVYRIVAGIPKGRVMSYSDVAREAGCPGASRAVGNAMRRNPWPGTAAGKVPCHRVVKRNGLLGSYSAKGGVEKKMSLLLKEGVKIIDGKVGKEFFINKVSFRTIG